VVVRAFALSPLLRQHQLIYVGDGPERSKIEKIIAENHLEECVSITGWVTQKEVGEWMRRAEIMAFPSIRELGAGVVVEAMACGMVPVVCDYGAPGALVGTDRGVRVAVDQLDKLVANYAKALEGLVTDPARIREMSGRARDFALEHFTWQAKAKKTLEIYQWILEGKKGPKPRFWPESLPSTLSSPPIERTQLSARLTDLGCEG
jgi:glycosyltransferase involved in cell wall biosynthesis